MAKKINTEEIIKRFKQSHGDEYDYSLVSYSKMKEKVEIVCSLHGSFWQTPDHHIRGTKCPECRLKEQGKLKKEKAANKFIEKSISIHGNIYDYSKTEYKGNKIKVEIICQKHGNFKQTPSNHLSGFGCSKCGRERTELSRKLQPKEFYKRCKELHSNFYSYPKNDYQNPESKIDVTCPKHGDYKIKARNHLWISQGCNACYKESKGINRRIPWSEFIKAAKKYHGNIYKYDHNSFEMLSEPLSIFCKKHGWFEQRGHKHIAGQGCPKCARQLHRGKWNSNLIPDELKNLNCNLYYFRLTGNSETFYKIGITNNVNRRKKTIERESNYYYKIEVVQILEGTLYSSMQFEELLHKEYKEDSYIPKIKFPGYTECFSIDVLS
ncbi:GIY-YIG nuclease family protein [Polaribacter sp. L3A8]|uniref:GIY-YIG nuclease family protein n=1 Tax=Polaribacter sp. L3A8 TaxID=2686361 RepID=UPI00131AACFD|nr:GIY-YIG nuclease family protein [Polaribacter sp. L3A8]